MPGEAVGSAYAVIKINLDENNVKGKFSSVADDMAGSATGMGTKIGTAMVAGIGVALAGVTALIGKSAMEWEKSMGGVFKTTGLDKGTEAANTLNDSLLTLYSTTKGASKLDISNVASGLGSLGIANDQVTGATKSILQAQGAFGVDAATATTQLGTISTLWAKQTAEAGGTAKMFDKAGSAINELGNKYPAAEKNLLSYLEVAGGIAGTFNQGYEATAAFGALLEGKGIKGSEAANALKSMTLEGLMAGSEQKFDKKTGQYVSGGFGYQYAADVLGIDDKTMKEKLSKDLYGTIIEISTAVSKLPITEFEKGEKLKKMFGAYGFTAASKLSGQEGQFKEMTATAEAGYAEGTSMSKEYERQTNNLTDSLSGLWNSIDTAGIKVFSDALQPAAEWVDKLAQYVRDATPAVVEFFKAFSSGDLSKVGKMINFDDIKNKALKAFQIIAGAAGVGLIISAVAKFGPVLLSAGRQFATMALTAVASFAKITVSAVVSSLITMVGWVSKTAASFLAVGVNAAAAFLSAKVSAVSSFVAMEASAVSAKLAFISTWAAALGPIVGIMGAVAGIAVALGALGYALDPSKFTIFNSTAVAAFNGIKDVVIDVWALIQAGDWAGVGDRLKTAFGDAIDFVKNLDWQGLGGEVVEMVGDGARAIIDTAFKLGDWIKSNVTGWISSGGPRRLGESIVDTIAGGIKSWMSSDVSIWDALKGVWGTAGEWLSLGYQIIAGIGSGIVGKVREYLTPAQNQFISFVQDITKAFFTLGDSIATAIGSGLDRAQAAAVAFVEWMAHNIPGVAASLSAAGVGTSTGAATPKTYTIVNAATNEKLASTTDESYVERLLTKYMEKGITGTVQVSSIGQRLGSNPNLATALSSMYGTRQDSSAFYTDEEAQAALNPGYSANVPDANVPGTQENLTPRTSVAENVGKTMGDAFSSTVDKGFKLTYTPISESLKNLNSDSRTTTLNYLEGLKWQTEADKASAGSTKEAGNFFSTSTIQAANLAALTSNTAANYFGAETIKAANSAAMAANSAAAGAASATVGAASQASALTHAAATALTLGGDAVRIGLTTSGQQIAVIGQVAQQQFTAAGGKWVSDSAAAGTAHVGAVTQAGVYHIGAMNQGAAIGLNAEAQKSNIAASSANATAAAWDASASKISNSSTELAGAGSKAASDFATGVGAAAGSFLSMIQGANLAASRANSGGSYSGGGNIGSATQSFTDCFFEGFTDSCTNMNINALKYTAPNGQISYINPMDNAGVRSLGGSSGQVIAGSSVGVASSVSNYKLPAYLMAKGGNPTRPTLALMAEKGEEMVLPHDITVGLKNMIANGGSGSNITIYPADVIIDGQKLAHITFKVGMKSAGTKGFQIV